MFKLLVICGCLVAVVHGGIISSGLIGTSGPGSVSLHPGTTVSLQPGTITFPSVSSSSSNIIRGIGNLGAISAYSKSVDTAFSSERKADVRINNPGVQTSILSAGSVPATLSYAATAPALAVSGTALAGGLTVATGPGLTSTGLGVGLNGVSVNGYGLQNVNGYGLQSVNGLTLGQLGQLGQLGVGTVKVL